MSNLTNAERINLKKMVDETECTNNTENIRKLKHSTLIRDDIRKIENLKTKNKNQMNLESEEFIELCKSESFFLFTNYTDIFNKVVKNELDLTIMTKLLIVLKLIEDGKVDQHEGSVMTGKILKELYVDSAMKRADNIDKEYEKDKIQPLDGQKISWKEYKNKIK